MKAKTFARLLAATREVEKHAAGRKTLKTTRRKATTKVKA